MTARLRRDLGCADDEALYRKLHIDARRFVEPVWNRPPDLASRGRHVGHRLSLDLLRRGRVPRTGSSAAGRGRQRRARFMPIAGRRATSSTMRAVTRAIEQDDGYRPIHAGCYEPFLLYGYLRGLQTSMEDLALRPEMADAILGHIFDFYYEHHRRIFEAGRGRIDLT